MVFATTVFIGCLANFITLEEQHLGAAFASINFGRQGRGVGKLQRDKPFPFGFEGGDVDDDAAASIGALTQADGQDAAWNPEILDRARQRKTIGLDDADIAFKIDEVFLIKIFRVNYGGVDIGEDFELARAADVVAIAGCAVADDALAVFLFDLMRHERLDHPLGLCQFNDLAVG